MVVIIGGGITGAATAYYLTKLGGGGSNRPYPVTVIDAVRGSGSGSGGSGPPASGGASSFAGAFLAERLGDGTRTEALHRTSFRLHSELADELGLRSYRNLSAYRVRPEEEEEEEEEEAQDNVDVDVETASETPVAVAEEEDELPPWLAGMRRSSSLPGRAAQVDPAELTGALMSRAVEGGAEICKGTVVGLEVDDDVNDDADDEGRTGTGNARRVTAVNLEGGRTVPVPDDIVVALGPWSCRLEDWLGVPMPVEGVWSTSLVWDAAVVDPAVQERPAALFCEKDSNGCHLEVLPRADGTLYVSGCGGSRILSPATLRATATGECVQPGETNVPDPSRASAAERSLDSLNPSLVRGRSADDIRACIRPVSPDGVPIVGTIPGLRNAYVGTAGGPWGITFGPAVGLSVARLILDDDPPINVRNFSPRRFDTPVYRTLLRQRGKQVEGLSVGEQW